MPNKVEIAFDAANIVGESIVWDDRKKALYWVDIVGRRIHALEPESGEHRSWETPEIVTSIGLRDDGGAIVGLRKSVALWNVGSAFQTLATIEPDIGTALDAAIASTPVGSTVHALPTYTAMLDLRGELTRRGLVDAYWTAS